MKCKLCDAQARIIVDTKSKVRDSCLVVEPHHPKPVWREGWFYPSDFAQDGLCYFHAKHRYGFFEVKYPFDKYPAQKILGVMRCLKEPYVPSVVDLWERDLESPKTKR